ncbi:MAG: peptide deformylase [Anaerolineae bacterium]|nr:peptide deformylase [Anaerolineae bacterium]
MTIREIITPENPILRKKARKVTNFNDPRLQALADDMVETLHDAPGVGLAAPQVAESVRLIVVHMPGGTEEDREVYGEGAGELYVVVNPEIVKASRETVDGTEGCLSVPGYLGTVSRCEMVKIRGQDRHGQDFRLKATGWLARVFQHEIDHLDGVLFIDKASKVWEVRPDEEPDGPEAAEAIAALERAARLGD